MPTTQHIETAVLVIDQGFGVLRLADDGSAVGLDLAPGVRRALDGLRAARVRIALAAPRAEPGRRCTPLIMLDQELAAWTVGGAPRDWIAACVAELGARPAATMLVSVDLAVRIAAHDLGLAVAPHAMVAGWLADGRAPAFVRIAAPQRSLARAEDFLPYFVEHTAATSTAWGAAPADAVDALGQSGALQTLHLDPRLVDPYLVRLDRRTILPRDAGSPTVVWSDDHLALLAVAPSQVAAVEQLTARRHGAIQAPMPSRGLVLSGAASWRTARLPGADRPHAERPAPAPSTSSGFAGPTAAAVQFDVARYAGAAPIDTAGTIASRHVRHPHAARAVQALIADLTDVGYAPYSHTFSYQGIVLSNVIADLPGTGLSPLPAQPLAHLRSTLRSPAAASALLASLATELGAGWVRRNKLDALPAPQLATSVERALGLGGWIPWWRGAGFSPGFGAELVIVACHLDSTAQGSSGFDPTTSPAPGADDDGSGIACVLAAARELAGLRGQLTHTVRFCFFNAEEQGLLGSAAYANHLKTTGAPVKAVICVDMAGYDVGGGRTFEIHAGSSNATVRDASTLVAQTVASWAAAATALRPAQIYRGTSSATQPDRDLYDPAIGRADHASFQQQGWPAVVVSEDFFINRAGEEAPEPNPNYHRLTDTAVNATYTADIARAITRAAQELAG